MQFFGLAHWQMDVMCFLCVRFGRFADDGYCLPIWLNSFPLNARDNMSLLGGVEDPP